MKFFIDTADVNEIKEGMALGVVDGVTTNPSLIAKTGRAPDEVIAEILELVPGPVSLEVVATDSDGMVAEAKQLAALGEQAVIKVPMTEDGLRATKRLSDLGIDTNVTLIFSPMQALLAAKAGATYVSPFVGRLDDISHIGMELPRQIVEIYENYGFETQLLVASVRNPLHVLEAALMGADVATIPLSVIKQLLKHPLTDIGLAKFLADWEKVPKK